MKDILKLGSADGKTNVTVIGTCLHPHALLQDLLQLPGWEHHFYQAVIEFPKRTDLWKTYQTLYSDLTDPNRGATALNFYHSNQALMDAGAKLLWPEADSLPKLYAMMVDEGEASFRSEKQNEPYDPDRQWFAMKDAHYFEFVMEGTTTIGLRKAKQTYFLDRDFERVVAFHDPALAEKSGSDYGAIVVAALDRYGHIYCLDAWVERQPIERQIQQALWMHQKWGFKDLYLETNNFQKLLQTPYKLAREQAGITTLKVHSVDQHTNKLHRISTMQPDMVNGHLLFHRGLCPRFLEQLELFPTAKDDGPDALHGAWSQLRKPRGHIQITPPR
ncbi:MAG: phage terminase large subunit [Vampirovibrionales bacterium]|nr:phage terminase large subunit [Vampirovibrionales bacterium]